jgi:methionyl-tRNA synthetase
MGKYYLTTTLPYVNAVPHMGHALEFVQADILARYHADVLGDDVFFNTGTDEHGLKIYRRAQEEGMDPQAYTDKYADIFKQILAPGTGLNIRYTYFSRTTDAKHVAAAQEFWKRCEANGDIYLKPYQTKYCVGCELEKTDSELVDGTCPLHPNLAIELIDEENYFFRFSKYQQPLLELYTQNPEFILPHSRYNEMVKFVEAGLEDFSISRLKKKMPWGVPVPGNDEHVMYVWFDALVNYISALDWPNASTESFESFWTEAVQIAGKDNLRQQASMWQAMLFSAGVPNSKQILIHGFITSGGQKMSKSLGNVVDPVELIQKHGTDALRFFLAREIPTFEDGDFTWERFNEAYQSGLANGLGNLVSRTLKMAATNGVTLPADPAPIPEMEEIAKTYHAALKSSQIKHATDAAWSAISAADAFVEKTEPFKKVKTDPEAAKKDIAELLVRLQGIATMVAPILPETAEKIREALKHPSVDAIPKLFPRLS